MTNFLFFTTAISSFAFWHAKFVYIMSEESSPWFWAIHYLFLDSSKGLRWSYPDYNKRDIGFYKLFAQTMNLVKIMRHCVNSLKKLKLCSMKSTVAIWSTHLLFQPVKDQLVCRFVRVFFSGSAVFLYIVMYLWICLRMYHPYRYKLQISQEAFLACVWC